jgi:hypothetical protein
MVELINSQTNDNRCLLITSQKITFVNLQVIWTNLNLHMSESFHVNMTFSSSVVHEKIFIWPHPIFVTIYPLKRNWSFIWTIQNPIYPRTICTKRDWNWPTCSGGEDFFPNINTCKYGFPSWGPSRPLWTIIWTILNLQYMRKLSCKYDSFCLHNSWEQRILNDPTPVCTISGNLYVNLIFSGSVVLGKKIFTILISVY